MAEAEAKCRHCLWWQFETTPDAGDRAAVNAVGYCRRWPPSRRENGVGAWPITLGDDWCGEFVVYQAPTAA